MAEEQQKPVVAGPAADTAAAPTEPTQSTDAKPAEPAAADDAIKLDAPADPTPAAAGAADSKDEPKPEEPITSGTLGYKAPGLVKSFRFSKKHFWLGDEPVSTHHLGQYLRGEKPEVAHPVAAWSSQTGKGLLFFAKTAEQKEHPAGVLNLCDATDLTKDGATAFWFKLGGHKHTFEAMASPERNAWFVAMEKAMADAKDSKDAIYHSEGYKDQLEKLKPAPAVPAAKEAAMPKKSTDLSKPADAADDATPARTGSASSSDEDKKKKAKSRSVSRGKRSSVFGAIFKPKEKVEEKKAEKEEEKEEEAAAKEESAAAPVEGEASTAAAAEEPAKAAEEAKPDEHKAEAEAAKDAPKEAEEKKPKPTKRASIFGNFVEKLKSPTTEKKESDVGPPPPAKDTETPTDAPKAEEAPAAVEAAETPKAEEAKEGEAEKPAEPKRGLSFGKFHLGGKEKGKSPTTETPAKADDAAKTDDTPAEEAEAPKEETKEAKEELPMGVNSTATATPPAKNKRSSLFGNLGGSVKKDKAPTEGEASEPKQNKLTGLFRNASKAGKTKKDKDVSSPPAKVDEAAEPTEPEPTTAAKPAEPTTIGDVVPDAVTVGQAPKSTPEVSATA